jgi:hypothetical protein
MRGVELSQHRDVPESLAESRTGPPMLGSEALLTVRSWRYGRLEAASVTVRSRSNR